MISRSYFRSHGLSPEAARAEGLLNRYPNINEEELASLIRAFSRYPLLDLALLAADDRLGAKLDAFHAEHGQKLRPRLSPFEWMIAIMAVIGLFVLLKDAMG